MAIEYNFKYMPLVGKLSGESMVQQTETAINEIAQIVNENTAQAEIINTLAETANSNSVEALEKANEALETSGRVYITETLAVNLDSYCESQLIYINNAFSQNLPVAHKGFLEVKTNDDKTQAMQVFADDVDKKFYVRTGAITASTVGDVTTYTASYGEWTNIPNSTDLANYLPVAGGTMSGDIEFSASEFAIKGNDIANDGEISVVGATDNLNGASLNLYGRNHTESGAFELNANNGTNAKTLKGDASGSLTWNGSITADAFNGNATKDGNGNVITSTYLPLNGGTMTGAITVSYVDFVKRSVNDNHLTIMGGTAYNNSASLYLTGGSASSNAGSFQLRAQNGTSYKDLLGKPDGTLTWNGTAISLNGHTHSYLPLAGGTMTGEIKRNGVIVSNTVDNSYNRICGGSTVDNGSVLTLWGKSHSTNAGQFSLKADNGSSESILYGKPNGNLTWDGSDVLTTATVGSYLSKDLSSSVSLSASTAKTIISMSLPAGRWIVKGFVRYTSVTANKIYGAQLTASANTYSYGSSSSIAVHSSNTGTLSVQTTHVWNQSSTATIYLCGYATAACTADNAVMQAIRIV